jgi:hypothetical protein
LCWLNLAPLRDQKPSEPGSEHVAIGTPATAVLGNLGSYVGGGQGDVSAPRGGSWGPVVIQILRLSRIGRRSDYLPASLDSQPTQAAESIWSTRGDTWQPGSRHPRHLREREKAGSRGGVALAMTPKAEREDPSELPQHLARHNALRLSCGPWLRPLPSNKISPSAPAEALRAWGSSLPVSLTLSFHAPVAQSPLAIDNAVRSAGAGDCNTKCTAQSAGGAPPQLSPWCRGSARLERMEERLHLCVVLRPAPRGALQAERADAITKRPAEYSLPRSL